MDEMERWHTVLENNPLILDSASEKRLADELGKSLNKIKRIDWGEAEKKLLWDMTPDEAYNYMGDRGIDYYKKLAGIALEKTD